MNFFKNPDINISLAKKPHNSLKKERNMVSDTTRILWAKSHHGKYYKNNPGFSQINGLRVEVKNLPHKQIKRVLRNVFMGCHWWLSGEESACQCRSGFNPWHSQDPTCHGATKPVHHNYWACAPEPGSGNYWAHVLRLLKPACPRVHSLQQERPLRREARESQRREASGCRN